MAGRNARPAVHHHVLRSVGTQHAGELFPQAIGGEHYPFIGDIALEEMIDRAGDVARRAVERLVRALEPLWRAGVDQQDRRVS